MRLPSALLVLFALGCGQGEEPRSAPRSAAESAPAESPEFRPIAGGVSWTAEEPLVYRRPRHELRSAEYEVREHPRALLTVSYFPPREGGGGDVQQNLDRWAGQFEGGAPEIARREVNDLPVATLDVRGTFIGRLGNASRAAREDGWRMLGAIVEGERGLVFFKLIGPEDAIDLAEPAFQRLVDSIHPE